MDRNYWQLGTWNRIPVSMHWTVLLGLVWLYLIFWGVIAAAIASAAYFLLLVVHEAGHSIALRRFRVPIQEIRLMGVHGETLHGYASPNQQIVVAWAGVGAQLVVLLVAWLVGTFIHWSRFPAILIIAAPILFVFTKLNIVLMTLALLPIGPFDGQDAWAVIGWARQSLRKRRAKARERILYPEKALSPERRRELEDKSSRVAADLIGKVSRKSDVPEDEL